MVWVVTSSVIGGLLLVAGAPKLRDRAGMLRVVQGYRLLPPALERPMALVLPYAEVLVGAVLVTGLLTTGAAVAATTLFLVFCAGLSTNLLRGRRDLDCGCFSFTGRDQAPRISWWHAGRALALALASLALAVAPVIFGASSVGRLEQAAGTALAGLLLAAAFAVGALRSVVHLGRRPVDDHLARAAYELRAPATPVR
ncbi:MauE/DoxX family redox-associated membrane protein [Nocardioides houyundeii]|uniref:MauE/DoxX family redox-associated membrane protein n=1 Tax=Nocardioides houyundeii TaxID=2045452 RepID=UPI000DF4B162|nr:MauE/DoxX family redox-associated membrane protein [Nocardioides houyundeii]